MRASCLDQVAAVASGADDAGVVMTVAGGVGRVEMGLSGAVDLGLVDRRDVRGGGRRVVRMTMRRLGSGHSPIPSAASITPKGGDDL